MTNEYDMWPSIISNNYLLLMVDRRGPQQDSYMKTNDIIGYIEPSCNYKITNNTCIATQDPLTMFEHNTITPSYVEINNNWDNYDDEQIHDTYNNILGNIGILSLDRDEITIPTMEANCDNIQYYGAQYVKWGDIIQFETNSVLPITHMTIGKNYAKDFLLRKDYGGGAYLEYHNTPHFHMPLNSGSTGYLLLGKFVNNKIRLTAFTIPYGYAIYTPPGVIHCDGFLAGDYCVVYTVTDNYSTVRLIHNGQPVQINITS